MVIVWTTLRGLVALSDVLRDVLQIGLNVVLSSFISSPEGDLLQIGDGTFVGQLYLPFGGHWLCCIVTTSSRSEY